MMPALHKWGASHLKWGPLVQKGEKVKSGMKQLLSFVAVYSSSFSFPFPLPFDFTFDIFAFVRMRKLSPADVKMEMGHSSNVAKSQQKYRISTQIHLPL